MCLYIDYADADGVVLSEGTRTARKSHHCMECGRTIDRGETYHYWSWLYDGSMSTDAMCGHCQAAIDLGHALTGCPKSWNISLLYDRDPESGYLANCAWIEEHPNLPTSARRRILRAWACGKRGWRWPDGVLMDAPLVPEVVA